MAMKKHVYASQGAAERALWAHAKAWGLPERSCEIRRAAGGGWVIVKKGYSPPRSRTDMRRGQLH